MNTRHPQTPRTPRDQLPSKLHGWGEEQPCAGLQFPHAPCSGAGVPRLAPHALRVLTEPVTSIINANM